MLRREEKAERSRRQVLDAALQLFSHQGFGATSVREIADAAKVSIGAVYHHFPDKESIFRELLDEYAALTQTKRFPFTRALAGGTFPDNLEQLGFAARDTVQQYRRYLALVYVDVIEFDGTHMRNFYGEMAQRLTRLLDAEGKMDDIRRKMRPGVSPTSALLLTSRLFFTYFTLEVLFGVDEPFGKNSADMVREIADILRNGLVS
jgi:AcrR family transcriptional regulator